MNSPNRVIRTAKYSGYRDMNGKYVPFETADEVFIRARAVGARVLLRLNLTEAHELEGIFYTNDSSLCA